jgi:DNA-binding winged helix-turn-helix (wHTH) protein
MQIETLYTQKFNIYLEQVAEAERLQIEEEKRVLREEKAERMIANAKKQGYKLKKEIREDNTIKLVLQKRIY